MQRLSCCFEGCSVICSILCVWRKNAHRSEDGAEFRSVIRKKRLALALCGHFLYVEGNGEEGKVHSDLVFAEVPEPFVLHVCLHLPEIRFRLCASFPPVAL